MKKKNKIIILFALIIVVPMALELLIGNLQINDTLSKSLQINNNESNADGNYVYKLVVGFRCKEDCTITINVDDDTFKYDVSKYDKRKTIKIDGKVNNIKINGKGKLKDLALKVQNNYVFNIYRYFFLLVITVLLALLVLFRDYFFKRLEKAFLVVSIGVGVLYIFCVPFTAGYTPDDQIHLDKAYSLLDGSFTYKSYGEIYSEHTPYYKVKTVEDNNDVKTYLNSKEAQERMQFENKTKITYANFAYLPAAIGMKIGKVLNLSYLYIFALGRIFNLITYVVICYFAIKLAKFGKEVVFSLSIMPSVLMLASSYSLDAITFPCLIMAISLFFNKYLSKDSIDLKWTLAFLSFTLVGCFSKAIFAPIILLPMVFERKQFTCKKQSMLYKLCLCFVFVIMCSTFVLPLLSNSGTPGDFRGGMVSASGQIKYIFGNLINFSQMFGFTITRSLFSKFLYSGTFVNFYYLGFPNEIVAFVLVIITYYIAVSDKTLSSIETRHRIIFGLATLIMTCMVYGAMYLSFSEVGADQISGVQTRYFIPLILLLLFTIGGTLSKKQFLSTVNKRKILVYSTILIFGYYFYTLVLLTCCA